MLGFDVLLLVLGMWEWGLGFQGCWGSGLLRRPSFFSCFKRLGIRACCLRCWLFCLGNKFGNQGLRFRVFGLRFRAKGLRAKKTWSSESCLPTRGPTKLNPYPLPLPSRKGYYETRNPNRITPSPLSGTPKSRRAHI